MPVIRLLIGVCLLAISGCVLTGQGKFGDTTIAPQTEHGLWITRWDYQSPEDVRKSIH